jgi:hypothetical protein
METAEAGIWKERIAKWVHLNQQAYRNLCTSAKLPSYITSSYLFVNPYNRRRKFGASKYSTGALRHCAERWKDAGSVPDSVIATSHWYNSSGRTLLLAPIQPPTEISTRNISCGAKAVSVPNVMKSGNLHLLEHSGIIQACTGITLPFFKY